MTKATFIHPSAEVAPAARIGAGSQIWNQAQVRAEAELGPECIVGKDAYVDSGVRVGARCKLQNGVYLYSGVTVEDGVFFGPRATTTNDLHPRAIMPGPGPDNAPRGRSDWVCTPTLIRRGASIGAGAVVVCGVTIGEFAMIAAGSVVTRSVPDYGLVRGNPARLCGAVCACGKPIHKSALAGVKADCPSCGTTVTLSEAVAAAVRAR